MGDSDRFAQFWNAYPKKRSKGEAEKAWNQLRKAGTLPQNGDILSAIARLKRTDDWQKNSGQFIPYPATWLRAKGWLDESVPTADEPPPTGPDYAKPRNRLLPVVKEPT